MKFQMRNTCSRLRGNRSSICCFNYSSFCSQLGHVSQMVNSGIHLLHVLNHWLIITG